MLAASHRITALIPPSSHPVSVLLLTVPTTRQGQLVPCHNSLPGWAIGVIVAGVVAVAGLIGYAHWNRRQKNQLRSTGAIPDSEPKTRRGWKWKWNPFSRKGTYHPVSNPAEAETSSTLPVYNAPVYDPPAQQEPTYSQGAYTTLPETLDKPAHARASSDSVYKPFDPPVQSAYLQESYLTLPEPEKASSGRRSNDSEYNTYKDPFAGVPELGYRQKREAEDSTYASSVAGSSRVPSPVPVLLLFASVTHMGVVLYLYFIYGAHHVAAHRSYAVARIMYDEARPAHKRSQKRRQFERWNAAQCPAAVCSLELQSYDGSCAVVSASTVLEVADVMGLYSGPCSCSARRSMLWTYIVLLTILSRAGEAYARSKSTYHGSHTTPVYVHQCYNQQDQPIPCPGHSTKLTGWAIGVIVASVVVGIAAIIGVAWWYQRRRDLRAAGVASGKSKSRGKWKWNPFSRKGPYYPISNPAETGTRSTLPVYNTPAYDPPAQQELAYSQETYVTAPDVPKKSADVCVSGDSVYRPYDPPGQNTYLQETYLTLPEPEKPVSARPSSDSTYKNPYDGLPELAYHYKHEAEDSTYAGSVAGSSRVPSPVPAYPPPSYPPPRANA
ncbi:hypothetical protein NM688_g4400 [Phlebia brevispora]|uniref:Uncharacterized protein n=1 Tax=Phlebia brevispora TaxID=194682 RepID=A0ACC1T3L8_9APHY|nr:hypothetical protein NM688_g4400 [Phlebia brevispora]